MTLTLSMLRCPDTVSPQSRVLRGGEFSIGRGADNDWVLADPDRHLSKRHCVIAFRSGEWQVTDHGTNGTFLNREPGPIGSGRARDLRDRDRLRLGGYEIEIRIEEEAAKSVTSSAFPPLGELGEFGSMNEGGSPPRFDEAVQADHSPGIEDAFRPPRAVALLGDDWDLDIGEPVTAPAPSSPAPAPSPSQPKRPPALPVADAAPEADTGLLAAFLRGAGLEDARPSDPQAAMTALGAAFRSLVGGLRETLIARAAIKGEFRIEQTMIRARGNNPLKFSAGDDDALAALLGVGRRTDMAPAEAISEALRDIRLHELATMAAMQSALRTLLGELSPARLRDSVDRAGSGAMLPAQRKARAWEAYEALHARMTQALADDFDAAFGRSFARAYERALGEAQAGEARRR